MEKLFPLQQISTTALTQQNRNVRQKLNAEFIESVAAKRRALIEENAPIIRAKYGDWLSNLDVEVVLQVMKSHEVCAQCGGLPCQKRLSEQDVEVVLAVYENLRYVGKMLRPCKFAKEVARRRRMQANFKRSKIPQKYIGKTFEDYEVTAKNSAAVEWAKWVIENPMQSLYYFGVTGCGKTLLASIIAQELLNKGISVIFGDVPSLLEDVKSTFTQNATLDDGFGYKKSAYDAIIDELCNVDMLILDDLGAENSTEWATERIYSIVNNRYNAAKPIIATSNYDANGLMKHYKGDFRGSRIVSRFREMGKIILVDEIDRRLRS